MFSSSGFPQLRRERETPPRPFVIPGKSSECGSNSSSNNALGMHFLEPVQRGLAYILPLRWCLVNGEPFPGEDDIACLHSLLQLHHRERLLSVGFSGTAHSVTALGRFKTMDAVSEPQTLAPNTLYHCACLTVLVSMLLVSMCLSHCAACLSAVSQSVASFQLAFQPWLTRV